MPSPPLWIALVLLLGPGCVLPQEDLPRPSSRAFDAPLETTLGRAALADAADHPGESGLVLLTSGLDAFAARASLIDRAERAIDLQYYILHDDLTGRWILARLLAAADRGVRVRMLLDDLGTRGLDAELAALDAHPLVEVRLFNPFARGPSDGLARMLDWTWRPMRLNHRMHNKLLAADGAVAVVGGRNLGDEYFDAAPSVNFADVDLLALGPVVAALGDAFDLYWESRHSVPLTGWDRLSPDQGDLEHLRLALTLHLEEHADSVYAERVREAAFLRALSEERLDVTWAGVRAVTDLPEKITASGDALEETLLIRRARPHWPPAEETLTIISPYFVPREEGVADLVAAVARGVRVRVLTNALASTDVPLVHAGYAASRRALVEGGVELHELRRSSEVVLQGHRKGMLGSSSASLHAKTFVADRRRVFVGSMNLDPRSVSLNTELGLVAESPALADAVLASAERAMHPEASWRVELEDGALVWRGTRDGEPVEHHQEPETSWWTRAKVWLLGWLPIQGQL